MERASIVYDSPIGLLKVEATSEGICALTWLEEDEKSEQGVETVKAIGSGLAKKHLTTCTKWLSAYFNGSLLEHPVPKPPLVIPKKGALHQLLDLNLLDLNLEVYLFLPHQVHFPTVCGWLCAVQMWVTL